MAYQLYGVNSSAPVKKAFAFALDERAYFESLTAAQNAAKDAVDLGNKDLYDRASTFYHFGQQVVVVENDVATMYKITPDLDTFRIEKKSGGVVSKTVTINKVVAGSDPNTYVITYNDGASATVAKGSKFVVDTIELATVNGINPKTDWVFPSTNADNCVLCKRFGKLVSLEQAGEVGNQVLQLAKNYTNAEIQKLDVTDNAVSGQFVTAVSEVDGKVVVSRSALQSSDLPSVPLEKLVNTGTMKEIPAAFLPSYVDDVIEIKTTDIAPASPTVGQYYYSPTAKKLYKCEVAGSWKDAVAESGKVYVDSDSNITYRWSGTSMVKIASDLALGETESTAYRGDRGKIAYDHATDSARITEAKDSGFYKIAVTAEGHVASVTEVQASDIPVDSFKFTNGTNKFTVTKPDGTTQDVTVTPSIDKVTQSSDGLMSKEDKAKLDGVSQGATKVQNSTTNGNVLIDGKETQVYVHATTSAVDAAAVKIGRDSEGHVVIGAALTGADVGVTATESSVTVDGTTFNKYVHPTYTEAAASAKKVGLDSTGHVVLGDALTKADVGLGLVKNQAITVTPTSVSDGSNTFNKYVHPTNPANAKSAAAVKVGSDAEGHVVLGGVLTKADVGLDLVKNQAITVTSTSVSDGTNTFDKYVHPTYAQADAAAKKVGLDSTGHVVLGDALKGADVGVSATTHSVTVDGTTFSHEYNETPVAAAAVKVGYDAKKHVVLGDALTPADLGISATTTSVTVGSTTFEKYVHPTYVKAPAAAKKVGLDSTGHVVLGAQLAVGDISGLTDELGKKQDNLGFTGTYSKTDNPVALKDYVDNVSTNLETLKDVQVTGSTNVVTGVTVDTNGKLSVTKGSVSESDLDNALSTKINNATSALHFIGVATALPDATTKKVGDVIIVGQKEYVCYLDEKVSPAVQKWSELGDESIYLTKTDAANTYETIANCNSIRNRLTDLEADTHNHANKTTLDAITADVKTGYDNVVTKAKNIASGATKVVDGDTNGTIKVTKSVNNVETTEVVTVYDDTEVKNDIAENTASIVALAAGKANKVVVNTSSTSATLLKVHVNDEGIVDGTKAVTKSDLDGVIGNATASQNGLMTSAQVTKLNGVAAGAQVNVVEGAKDANGAAFTIENKMIVIDQIILDGGSATSAIS